MPRSKSAPPWARPPPFARNSDLLNVIVETVQGSRNKLKFDEDRGLFRLSNVLPAGEVFPFDFGFVPSTRAADGDPIDVLILNEGPTSPGCLIQCRVLGVIEARQKERDGRIHRNDRLIAVADVARRYARINALDGLGHHFLAELEHFFTTYVQLQGKVFMPSRRRGPRVARTLVEDAANKRRRDTR